MKKHYKDEWCWLAEDRNETTCALANGRTVTWSWARYMSKDGSGQIDCSGNLLNLSRKTYDIDNPQIV